MIIHVVRPGDNPWLLASTYGVSADSIVQINGLKAQTHLVVGQALVIPAGVNFKYGVIESNGFIQPTTPEKEAIVLSESASYLTYLSAFSHHIKADGSLMPLETTTINNIGKANKNALMLSVTNLSESNFDTQAIDRILKSNNLQQTLINNILAEVRRTGYYGVIIDFERISPENRELYNSFLRKIATALHQENKILSTALAPKTFDIETGSWHGAHDYRAHGQIVDFVIIMTYEWGWSGGATQFKQ